MYVYQPDVLQYVIIYDRRWNYLQHIHYYYLLYYKIYDYRFIPIDVLTSVKSTTRLFLFSFKFSCYVHLFCFFVVWIWIFTLIHVLSVCIGINRVSMDYRGWVFYGANEPLVFSNKSQFPIVDNCPSANICKWWWNLKVFEGMLASEVLMQWPQHTSSITNPSPTYK